MLAVSHVRDFWVLWFLTVSSYFCGNSLRPRTEVSFYKDLCLLLWDSWICDHFNLTLAWGSLDHPDVWLWVRSCAGHLSSCAHKSQKKCFSLLCSQSQLCRQKAVSLGVGLGRGAQFKVVLVCSYTEGVALWCLNLNEEASYYLELELPLWGGWRGCLFSVWDKEM